MPESEHLIATPLDYADVAWFRRRWFVVTSLILFAPVALAVVATGPVYARRNGAVYRYSETRRRALTVFAAGLIAVLLIQAWFGGVSGSLVGP